METNGTNGSNGIRMPGFYDPARSTALRVRDVVQPTGQHEPDVDLRDQGHRDQPGSAPPEDHGDEYQALPDRLFKAVPPRGSERTRRLSGLRIAVVSLLRERRRLLLSMLIVALGIAYLAGSLSLLGRVSQGLADLAGTGTERADLVLEGTVAFDSPLEQVRQLIPDSLRSAVRTIPGVAATDSRIDDTAILIDDQGKPVVKLGITERPAGANWPTVAALNPYRLEPGGRGPLATDEVVIDRATAKRAGIIVGDNVLVATKTTPRIFKVVGLATLGGRDLPPGSSLALFTTDSARGLFERGTDDNSIGIQLAEGADIETVSRQIRRVLPPGVELADAATFEQHRETSLAKSFTLITILLIGFAALALVVGAFTVANSNALLFARRRSSFALLRLVGASPRQLLGAATVEAAVVGVIAVVIGIPLGLLVGRLIESVMGSLGAPIPAAGPSVTFALVAACLVVGIGVTMFTALLPARDAARVPPIAAVTRTDDRTGRDHPWWRLVGWAAVGAVIGLALAGQLVDGAAPMAIGAAAGAVTVTLLSLLPRLLTGLVSATTKLFVGRSTALRSLVALRSRSARSRAASTTVALLMATFVVSSLSTISSSFVASIDQQVSETLIADVVVDSGTFTRGGLPSALLDDIADVDGVDAVSGVRVGRATVGSVDTRLAGMNGADMFKLVDLGDPKAPASLNPNGIAISEQLASQIGAKRGAQILVSFPNGTENLTVESIYPRASTLLGDAIIDSSVLVRTTPSSVDIVALVDFAPGATLTALPEVKALATSYGVDQVLPPAQLINRRTEVLRGFEQVIQWMLIFSVLLAVIGVANTLQLGVNERRRELGLLRAVGASRRQVIRIVLVEAAALSLVGVILGTLLGVGLAVAAVSSLASLGLQVTQIPWPVVGGTAFAALSLGLIGAWVPAVRAARTGVMEALGDDHQNSAPSRRKRSIFHGSLRSPSLMDELPTRERIDRPPEPSPEQHDEPGTAGNPEESMSARCYNCGNDPGEGERCQVCDASLTAEPLGMFSTSPLADVPPVPVAPSPSASRQSLPSSGMWSRGSEGAEEELATASATRTTTNGNGNGNGNGAVQQRHEDIFDAAVIDEDDAIDDDRFETEIAWDTTPPETGQPLGSLFDGGDPSISPFAQKANGEAPVAPPVDDRAAGPQWSAPWAPTAPQPQFSTPQQQPQFAAPPQPQYQAPPQPQYQPPQPQYQAPPQPQYQPPQPQYQPPQPQYQAPYPTPQQPQYQPPQQPQYQPPQQTQYAPPQQYPPQYQPAQLAPAPQPAPQDDHGLAGVIARLSPASQQAGSVAFTIAGALLAPDEVVLGAAAGWALGLPTVTVLTTTRVLIVGERRYRPMVEIFGLRPGLAIHGRHFEGTASLAFQDGERLVSVDQIPDVQVAVELATAARSRMSGTGF